MAHGQGLLSIGHSSGSKDFESRLPFTTTIASSVGWDSNTNSSSGSSNESAYWQNGISVAYSGGTSRTHLGVSAGWSNIWYFDPAPGQDSANNNARISIDLVHRVNPRLTISDSLYFAYEVEPDYAIGASTTRRTDQYYYGHNNLSVSYAWSPRFSTVTSYTITGVEYEDDFSSANNRIEHIFGQQFRYSLSRLTALTFDYRFALTQYDGDGARGDYQSHFILAGLEHTFSPDLKASFRAGAELREYDSGGSTSNPYAEGALEYRVGKRTSLRWYHFLGMDDSDRAGYAKGYSYRTGLSANHQLTDRLSISGGAHYVHYDLSGSDLLTDNTEDTISLGLNLDYRLWRNVSVNTGYWFTSTASDTTFRDYDRHSISLGLKATF